MTLFEVSPWKQAKINLHITNNKGPGVTLIKHRTKRKGKNSNKHICEQDQ